ncbi:MAG TPA: hypothetical protein PL033_09360 [Candidatus Brocadiia bacterium]|nr:hypothetical protein [Candidatus Brocadiia bacterium]
MRKTAIALALGLFAWLCSRDASAFVVYTLYEGTMQQAGTAQEVERGPGDLFWLSIEMDADAGTPVGGIRLDLTADTAGIVDVLTRDIDETEWYENDGMWDNSAAVPAGLDDTVPFVLETVHYTAGSEASGIYRVAHFLCQVDPSAPLGDYVLDFSLTRASDGMGFPYDPSDVGSGGSFTLHVTPEPTPWLLLALGLGAANLTRLGGRRRRRDR